MVSIKFFNLHGKFMKVKLNKYRYPYAEHSSADLHARPFYQRSMNEGPALLLKLRWTLRRLAQVF